MTKYKKKNVCLSLKLQKEDNEFILFYVFKQKLRIFKIPHRRGKCLFIT